MAGGVDAVLVGPVSIDNYVTTGDRLPGGGALNMAYHWSRLGVRFELISRVSVDDEVVVAPFLQRHHISHTGSFWQRGPSCSIDVVIRDDRQPWMDNFVEGVWADFVFDPDELDVVLAGAPTHLVLVDVVDRELVRRRDELAGARLSGDFLDFRHFDIERFDVTFPLLEIGVIGWPGDPGAPTIDALGRRTADNGNVLVVTFGPRGVVVYDGRSGTIERSWFDVAARSVTGTTIGCGDAFIAAYLASWYADADIAAAVERGMAGGAAATEWMRPLPDAAYR